MSEEGKFLIYCIELYRAAKGISGRDAYELFRSTGADDYVRCSYGALHTTGERYILEDIDGFLANAVSTETRHSVSDSALSSPDRPEESGAGRRQGGRER